MPQTRHGPSLGHEPLTINPFFHKSIKLYPKASRVAFSSQNSFIAQNLPF
jgi:hypothetical protein